ncbi:3D-(3,5/4)-trihydroxycyclohexane-1,2-dione acylhydrolase (decyclizing) [Verrucomicrobiales bacterium]|jgi:3D-(3,5/4)-trihydroxycyclohexane-1,2-dione acylhydrolase (decyclizing)|nr:3D-(3,5/4)-trihydroxycyclohexane-1,2-dione acylhydrolase (decyclizing) [Verrucomicrobiales bacterium]MDF1787113.1 3D-(3,5/4)-trihydroxycyclohexane-1,2-dione acylhydrolase (decyclizing) [Verrucomicrobiales bacterium]
MPRLTVAQATITYLKNQHVARDGQETPFFAGCFGIFGHGNVAGLGQALHQDPGFTYYQCRNEQAMVHTAVAYAKVRNRLGAFACTTSIGPGATNMVTGAALATVNRLPVLLLPGDIFARRNVAPVLQQIELPHTQDHGANDAFKPVSRYWDRINRAEQLITSLPEAMRVLISQGDTGAVTLAMPQDVQAEAFDFPDGIFEKKVWTIARPRPDRDLLQRAAEWIKSSKRPMIITGGGTIYSEATDELRGFVKRTGIPVAETMAGKGALRYDDPCNLGAAGVTGTEGANVVASEADLVIGIGTRYSDFTTASKTAWQDPNVRFININVTDFDAFKHGALPLVGDARVVLEELEAALESYAVDDAYRAKAAEWNQSWDKVVDGVYHLNHGVPVSQGEVIGAVNDAAGERDIVLCAAGSLPGDLHKLWRTRDPKGYHLEYGYSCMGYEIAGGLGAKMADPTREIFVMVGDGSYLMMAQELITAVQEGIKLTILLLNNNGYGSIGGLSTAVGSQRFGTQYRYRDDASGQLDGDHLPVDLAANARSLGAEVIECTDIVSVKGALVTAKASDKTTVIYVETDLFQGVDGYTWWEVPVAEVSEVDTVKEAYQDYEEQRKKQRNYM